MVDMTDIMLGVASVAMAFSTLIASRRKDNTRDGERNGAFTADLTNIKTLLEEVRDETREIKHSVSDHGERIAKCEAKLTSALLRVERIERQLDIAK